MEKDKIVLISLTQEELQNLISNAIKTGLAAKQEKELLSFKEVCALLNISASCLNQWKFQGKINFKRIGKRIYLFKS